MPPYVFHAAQVTNSSVREVNRPVRDCRSMAELASGQKQLWSGPATMLRSLPVSLTGLPLDRALSSTGAVDAEVASITSRMRSVG